MANAIKVMEAFARAVKEFTPFHVLVLLLLLCCVSLGFSGRSGAGFDELEDEGAAGDDVGSSRQEIAADLLFVGNLFVYYE